MKIVSNDGDRANVRVTVAEVQQIIYAYERWIKTLCEENKQLKANRDEVLKHCHKRLGFLENCIGGDEKIIHTQISAHREYLEILERGKE